MSKQLKPHRTLSKSIFLSFYFCISWCLVQLLLFFHLDLDHNGALMVIFRRFFFFFVYLSLLYHFTQFDLQIEKSKKKKILFEKVFVLRSIFTSFSSLFYSFLHFFLLQILQLYSNNNFFVVFLFDFISFCCFMTKRCCWLLVGKKQRKNRFCAVWMFVFKWENRMRTDHKIRCQRGKT